MASFVLLSALNSFLLVFPPNVPFSNGQIKISQAHLFLLPQNYRGHSTCLPTYKIYVISFIPPKLKCIYFFIVIQKSAEKNLW